MTSLLTQDYLRTNGLAALEAKHSIHIKRRKDYPNLVLLKYDQILTTMTPMTRECRGLILDESKNWECVCYSYSRFQNWGETWGDTIDWRTSKVLEKVDGSLIQLYYYDGAWRVSTSGMPDAAGQVGDFNITFEQLFWDTWNALGYKLPDSFRHPGSMLSVTPLTCYAFELLTPFNQLVVRQAKSRIVLHGVRDLSDFGELNPEPIAAQYGWDCVKSWPLNGSVEQLIEFVNARDPFEYEGVVVTDANFHRVKIKSLNHILLSHMKDNLSSSNRNMIEIIRKNEDGELLSKIQQIQELKEAYDDLKAKYDALVEKIEATYESLKYIPIQKDFALQAVKFKYSRALFQIKKGINVRQYLLDINIKTLEEWLD
jgi:hypothetical protein